MFWWMPSRRHSSAIFSSPRNPSSTIRTFSSAEYFLRVRRRISRTVASTATLVSSFMVYSLASLILTRKSHLSFSPSSVSQVLTRHNHNYALTSGRFVGSVNGDDDEEDFEEKMPRLVENLKRQLAESEKLSKEIRIELQELGYE